MSSDYRCLSGTQHCRPLPGNDTRRMFRVQTRVHAFLNELCSFSRHPITLLRLNPSSEDHSNWADSSPFISCVCQRSFVGSLISNFISRLWTPDCTALYYLALSDVFVSKSKWMVAMKWTMALSSSSHPLGQYWIMASPWMTVDLAFTYVIALSWYHLWNKHLQISLLYCRSNWVEFVASVFNRDPARIDSQLLMRRGALS